MNLGEASIRYKTSLLVMMTFLFVGGLLAYQSMGRLEDPEFTIKQAQIRTPYPGATAEEVEKEVTDRIERAVQQLGALDYVESTSMKGMSIVEPTIKDKYDKTTLPQVWDELRRKINDMQAQLPPGAGPSIVNDDFGDVYGVFFALTGEGYSYADLRNIAKFLQRELLTVVDVAKIELVGDQPEVVYIELARDKMAQFGVPRQAIYQMLRDKNLVENAGQVKAGSETITLRPTGEITDVSEFGDLLISGDYFPQTAGAEPQRLVYLRDVATITRGYQDPPTYLFRVDGKPAVGLAISTVQGGNVVVMGEALTARMQQLAARNVIPFGIKWHKISIQSEAVTASIQGFVINLVEAVAIVIIVLLLFMGLRSGLIIGVVLLVTIVGSFVFMKMQGIMLERISLGALVIALGMLVDNAIVITEGMLIRIGKGEDRIAAARKVVGQNSIPLLGATVIAILAFAAIGASQDSTGEYCRSLFQVIMISLGFSWVTAVTLTPLLCAIFLKPVASGDADPYSKGFFLVYRRALVSSLRHRYLVAGVTVATLVVAIIGFGRVDKSFFPPSTRGQFMVDVWLPEGTHIRDTEKQAIAVEKYLQGLKEVTDVSTFIGRGAPRFLLTYTPEKPNNSYAFLLVSVKDATTIPQLIVKVQSDLEKSWSNIIPQTYMFVLGPGDPSKIQIRVSGPDIAQLRSLSNSVAGIMRQDGGLMAIQSDWRDMVKDLRPVLAEAQARQNGIERKDVANLLAESFDGRQIGVFRDGDDLLSIVARSPEAERLDLNNIRSLQIWSPAAGRNIPLEQVVSDYQTVFTDNNIKRRDRTRTITIKANPRTELASDVLARLMPKIDALKLPSGYAIAYGGEYEDSAKAQNSLIGKVIACIIMMILIVILLFNNLRQPLIIWLTVPLTLIGVTAGLLAFNQPFGFMALLGLLSLSGMQIKNAIVLIDEMNQQVSEGKPMFEAIVVSGVSRIRPVMMAAATTVLGMAPLLKDAFFVAMAVTIMAGLTLACVLTLIVVPVITAIIFHAQEEKAPVEAVERT